MNSAYACTWIAVGAVVSVAGCSGGTERTGEVTFADKGPPKAATKIDFNKLEFTNAFGVSRTISGNRHVDLKKHDQPFFISMGTNGRACVHCHMPNQGWSITPEGVTWRFSHPIDVTNANCVADPSTCAQEPNPANYGLDPIFRTNDGSVSPKADVSTAAARRSAYAMLLTKGLIRVGIGIPAGAEFTLIAVDDPYGYASAAELSLFRRPLPCTNLSTPPTGDEKHGVGGTPVLTAVMWDGRETFPGQNIIFDLLDQSNGATLGHAQATAGLSTADRQSIVDFETGLLTAQSSDDVAGDLTAEGANGGPDALQQQSFYYGINDVVAGDYQTHAPFNPSVFTMYANWSNSGSSARQAVARGEAIFNTKPIAIAGVAGLNDVLNTSTLNGACSTCHDAPGFGNHSVRLPIDIGVSDASLRTPDMPLYTLRNTTTGATVQTTDPGRALVTGKWADIGKFKGPILRGLAARAPYFHNGGAADLGTVVDWYDQRFRIGFSTQERSDLIAFLRTL